MSYYKMTLKNFNFIYTIIENKTTEVKIDYDFEGLSSFNIKLVKIKI